MAYRRILIVLMLAGSGSATAAGGTVPEGYVRVAIAHGVPPEALYSVTLTETAIAPRSIAAVAKQKTNLPVESRPGRGRLTWRVRDTATPAVWRPGRRCRCLCHAIPLNVLMLVWLR